MALVATWLKAQGAAEQAAKDKANADSLQAEYDKISAEPLSADDAFGQLRARASPEPGGNLPPKA